MSILLQGGRFKKRLMPIFIVYCVSGLFATYLAAALPKHYNVMPMQVLNFI